MFSCRVFAEQDKILDKELLLCQAARFEVQLALLTRNGEANVDFVVVFVALEVFCLSSEVKFEIANGQVLLFIVRCFVSMRVSPEKFIALAEDMTDFRPTHPSILHKCRTIAQVLICVSDPLLMLTLLLSLLSLEISVEFRRMVAKNRRRNVLLLER